MHVILSVDMLSRTRHCLRRMLPGIRASHMAEAVAAGFGFASNITLHSWLRSRPDPLMPHPMDMNALGARLTILGYPDRVTHVVDCPNLAEGEPRMSLDAFGRGDVDGVREDMMTFISCGARCPEIDERWLGRMDRMLGAVLRVLKWLSVEERAEFTPRGLVDHMQFLRLRSLCRGDTSPDLPTRMRVALKTYLGEMPDYEVTEYRQAALDQHGYAAMQLYRILSDACQSYGNLSNGSVLFTDLVWERGFNLLMIQPSGPLDDSKNNGPNTRFMADTSDSIMHPGWTCVGSERTESMDTTASIPLGFICKDAAAWDTWRGAPFPPRRTDACPGAENLTP